MGIQKIMMDSEHLPARHMDLLGLLQEELSRTEIIISGLLTYARPLKPDKRPLLLSEELRKALLRIEARQNVKHIGIDLKILEEDQVAADVYLMHQLFENLLSNAIDAQPDGGNITIELFIENGFQIVRISNRGRIPPRKILEQIFDPYFTRKTRGTGLGLAICQRVMNAHDGFLRARVEADTFIMEAGFLKEAGRGSG
jgi:signal transduction histidine kinase